LIIEKIMPTPIEIHQALPPEGLLLQELIKMYRPRITQGQVPTFVNMVKAVTTFDKNRGVVIPLPKMPSDEHINAVMRGTPKAAKAANPA
jgi:transcription initiation factor TFIIF subunit alpha